MALLQPDPSQLEAADIQRVRSAVHQRKNAIPVAGVHQGSNMLSLTSRDAPHSLHIISAQCRGCLGHRHGRSYPHIIHLGLRTVKEGRSDRHGRTTRQVTDMQRQTLHACTRHDLNGGHRVEPKGQKGRVSLNIDGRHACHGCHDRAHTMQYVGRHAQVSRVAWRKVHMLHGTHSMRVGGHVAHYCAHTMQKLI